MITWQYQTVTLGYRFIDDSWQIAQNPGTGQAEEGSMFFVCFFFSRCWLYGKMQNSPQEHECLMYRYTLALQSILSC